MADQNNAPELLPCKCGWRPVVHGAFDMGYLIAHDCEYVKAFRITDNERSPVIAAWNRCADRLARADRAAPEGQVRVSKARPRRTCKACGRQTRADQVSCTFCGVWDEAAALTPPPAAPTDNTALVDVLASLAAAISLLERGGKKAAPSDKMFEQMLIDYRASLERGRTAALAGREAPPACQQEAVRVAEALQAAITYIDKGRDGMARNILSAALSALKCGDVNG